MPNTSGSVDLGSLSGETQENLAKMAEEHGETGDQPDGEPEAPQAVTAFIVAMLPDGNVQVLNHDAQISIAMPPNNDLVTASIAVVQKDMIAQETAQHTIHLQMMQARAMQEQMVAAQTAQRLGDLRGGQRG